MQKIKVGDKVYRIESGTIPDTKSGEKLRAEFAKFGIIDYVNALAPGARNRYTQLFVMEDGTAQIADGRIVHTATRNASKHRL